MSNPTTPFSWQMPTATDLVTDLPADFEVFGQAVATSMADLLGGASGYILSKASATDMDFAWIANDQGDITGITATTPLTGGGSSGAITVGIQDALTTQKGAVQLSDSTSTTSSILAATPTAVKSAFDTATTANTTANAAIPKSTVTTNGDVIYATGSSAVTRLGIGSAGQVLTVAAGVPSWATAASGGGLTLLETITFNNTVTTYTSATIAGTYKNLRIVGQGLQEGGTAAGEINLRFNGDTGSNYQYAFVRNTNATLVGRPTSGAATSSIVTCQSLALSADTSIRFGQIQITIPLYSGANYKSINYQCSDNSGGQSNNGAGGGTWNNTAAITSITFIEGNSANFKAGSLKIYGES